MTAQLVEIILPAEAPSLVLLPDAEGIILAFCGVLLGQDGHGAGLLSRRIDGRFHTEGCPIGMRLRPNDRLTGGSPCSDRCESTRAALNGAERYLRSHEAPRQLALADAGAADVPAVEGAIGEG